MPICLGNPSRRRHIAVSVSANLSPMRGLEILSLLAELGASAARRCASKTPAASHPCELATSPLFDSRRPWLRRKAGDFSSQRRASDASTPEDENAPLPSMPSLVTLSSTLGCVFAMCGCSSLDFRGYGRGETTDPLMRGGALWVSVAREARTLVEASRSRRRWMDEGREAGCCCVASSRDSRASYSLASASTWASERPRALPTSRIAGRAREGGTSA